MAFNISVLVVGIMALIVTLFQSIKLFLMKYKTANGESNINQQFNLNDTKKRLKVSLIVLNIFIILNGIIILM